MTIVQAIKDGDESGFSILLNYYTKMIYKIINSLSLNKGDYEVDCDSLFQEGSIALYNAVISYEDDKGMKFSSYAYMLIHSRIYTYYRDNYSKISMSIDTYDNIEYFKNIVSTSVNENPIQYHENLEFEKCINSFIQKLKPCDQRIFKLRSEDYSYKDIAKIMNMKYKQVDNRLRILKKLLKRHLEARY